jgi:hypothetical protein
VGSPDEPDAILRDFRRRPRWYCCWWWCCRPQLPDDLLGMIDPLPVTQLQWQGHEDYFTQLQWQDHEDYFLIDKSEIMVVREGQEQIFVSSLARTWIHCNFNSSVLYRYHL